MQLCRPRGRVGGSPPGRPASTKQNKGDLTPSGNNNRGHLEPPCALSTTDPIAALCERRGRRWSGLSIVILCYKNNLFVTPSVKTAKDGWEEEQRKLCEHCQRAMAIHGLPGMRRAGRAYKSAQISGYGSHVVHHMVQAWEAQNSGCMQSRNAHKDQRVEGGRAMGAPSRPFQHSSSSPTWSGLQAPAMGENGEECLPRSCNNVDWVSGPWGEHDDGLYRLTDNLTG
jgi:hypothetical protein